jgi:hypothetical protein
MKTKQSVAGLLIAGAGIGAFTGMTATATASATPSVQAATSTHFNELPEWRRIRRALPSDDELPLPRFRAAFTPGVQIGDLPEPRLRRALPSMTELPEGRSSGKLFDAPAPEKRQWLFDALPEKRKRG